MVEMSNDEAGMNQFFIKTLCCLLRSPSNSLRISSSLAPLFMANLIYFLISLFILRPSTLLPSTMSRKSSSVSCAMMCSRVTSNFSSLSKKS